MKVSRRAVQLGELTGNEVQILDGLAEGDLVAVSGVSHLRDGMQVRRYEQ
jgi:membrane fusion protein (multidrug efflux system)